MPLKQHSANTHILGVGNCFFGIEQGDQSEQESITMISELQASTPTAA